ncbi:MAG: hypothetical protein M3024_14250 [Candidatus Dormibacteraeota bacterium]|nr:hypothetical protein [Candidatus Dormibacteraeota bacterium]
MSQAAIRELADTHAFNARPRTSDQRQVYVPFDDLQAGARAERRVADLVQAGSRVGLVGPTGSGKSSLIEYVLARDPFALVTVPVSLDDDRVAGEPKLFAQHLVRALCRYGDASARLEQEDRIRALTEASDRDVRTADRLRHARGGVNVGLLRGDAAVEFASSAVRIDLGRPATEIARAAGRLFDLLRAHELQPVVAVDDSDKWLAAAAEPMIEAFFGRVLPWIAELGTAIVVALQPAPYLRRHAYREARRAGVPEHEVTMPGLVGPVQVAGILGRRIDVGGVAERVERIFTPDAVQALFDYYAGEAGHSLRKMLNAANCAVDLAAEAGAAAVDGGLMKEGIADR